jgi:hypothetical protein
MATTGRHLIRGALKLLGVVAAGENPSAQEQTDALASFNDMLDSWSTESLIIFSKTIEDFSFPSSQQVFTMGMGGDFATSRPLKILHLATVDNSVTPANEIPISIINLDQWADQTQKSTQSTYATKCYIDYSNPLVSLNFWPIPTLSNTLRCYSMKALSQVSTPDTVIDLPPGYQQALKYNLAIVLAPEYGRQVPAEVAAIATTSKATIERMNIQPLLMTCDPAVMPSGKTWDWRIGE